MKLMRPDESGDGLTNNNFRIFDRVVKATAQHVRKLTDIGFYEAATRTDRERKESNATLRDLFPSAQMGVKTRKMTFRQEYS